MNKLKPAVNGNFTFNLNKYPYLRTGEVTDKVFEFVKRQYPSKFKKHERGVSFSNKLFRIKVSRAQNVLRAFHKGEIQIVKSGNEIIIKYEGKLTRGIAISALHTLIAIIVFAFAAPTAIYFAPLFFIFNYILQIYLTHIVFPMNLGKALHELLKKESNENSKR